MAGEVTDERGHAVSDATVFAYGVGTVVTDSDGRYALDLPPGVGHLETKVEKSGYEKNEQYLLPIRASQSFVLRDVIRIAAGESRQVDVGPADSQFGFEYEYVEQGSKRQVDAFAQLCDEHSMWCGCRARGFHGLKVNTATGADWAVFAGAARGRWRSTPSRH